MKRNSSNGKNPLQRGIYYDKDEECREAFNNLVNFFNILIQMDQQQKEPLIKNTPPQGI
jgi:hypothetical protein